MSHGKRIAEMKVGVNLAYLRPGGVGGSEVYTRELIKALNSRDDIDLRLYCNSECSGTFEPNKSLKVIEVSGRPFTATRRLIDENVRLAKFLRRDPVDVLFSPASIAAPFLCVRIPQVVTIHDLQHLAHPSNFTRNERLMRSTLFRASAWRCKRVIVISESTRRDLLEWLKLPPEKVEVIYEGVPSSDIPSKDVIDGVLRHHGIAEEFFIFPAMAAPNKNHRLLLSAFRRLKDGGFEGSLVLTGKQTRYTDEVMGFATELGLSTSVKYLGYVTEVDLAALMSSAIALVYPSAFEGFGLPVVEAFKYGLPAVVSNSSSLPEVCGDAALLLDPHDAEAWEAAMQEVRKDRALRERLIERGHERVKLFTWETTAKRTVDVFQSVVASR